jgi:hypothetical protein
MCEDPLRISLASLFYGPERIHVASNYKEERKSGPTGDNESKKWILKK